MMNIEIIKNSIFENFLLKNGFNKSDIKIWYRQGNNFIRENKYKRDIITIDSYDENSDGKYKISINYGIKFREVEDLLTILIQNNKRCDTELTIHSNKKDGFISTNKFSLYTENIDTVLLDINKQLEAKAFPYFEEYQTLQDVNDKLFPLQSISEMTNLPRYSNAFLRDYTTEKAMITLKICQNPNFNKYLKWYKDIVKKKVKSPREEWKKDYNVFLELDRTFLSK
ncbi:hypothetical protein [Flammeovirga aprica]|uniref:Uncharacterized protein n=1 Tax=Flammeovirga aprica JL-4 TaxID=694437 RepID=A0A7X9XDK5_9BACT|nr:hypothetical protein [Flammeovirga aprica]NME72895.1 hypothetical protein [Flammeovirga aprica JL-4]